MKNKTVFWYVLLIASFVAASVSLLTTGVGLDRYLSFFLAWPLAIAVQAGLFGMAWLIAIDKGHLRALIIVLYCLTMPFSVVFSYVMLQSEITERIKPQETQRALHDRLRKNTTSIGGQLEASVAEAEELTLRLASWLQMEQDQGWTMSTCEGSDHPYLTAVCERITQRIAAWETGTGRSYRQGPGKQLIYGLLETELASVSKSGENLTQAAQTWPRDFEVFVSGIDNRERLRRYDDAIMALPRRDMDAMTRDTLVLPEAPSWSDFSRDDAGDDESPVYAFEDLQILFDESHEWTRSDAATLFAFALALFVDLFVLFVAIGAAILEGGDGGHSYPVRASVPPEWGNALRRDINDWIDASLLGAGKSNGDRRRFLADTVESLRFDPEGSAVLIPDDDRQRRFGQLLVCSNAAELEQRGAAGEASTGYRLQNWVYPALMRHLVDDGGNQSSETKPPVG